MSSHSAVEVYSGRTKSILLVLIPGSVKDNQGVLTLAPVLLPGMQNWKEFGVFSGYLTS